MSSLLPVVAHDAMVSCNYPFCAWDVNRRANSDLEPTSMGLYDRVYATPFTIDAVTCLAPPHILRSPASDEDRVLEYSE
jgi:hypothetical protein